jgi:hypothetical protein
VPTKSVKLLVEEYKQLKRDLKKSSKELKHEKTLLESVKLAKKTALHELNQEVEKVVARAGTTNTFCVYLAYSTTSYRWRAYSLLAHMGSGIYKRKTSSPQPLSESMQETFTMGGKMPFKEEMMDLSIPSGCSLIFTQKEIDDNRQAVEKLIDSSTPEWLIQLAQQLKQTVPNVDVFKSLVRSTGAKRIAFTHSRNLHLVDVILDMGLEITLLTREPVQNKTKDVHVKTIQESIAQGDRFDLICCLSEIEHLGMGLWGDNVDPNADLAHMNEIKQLLTPEGLCLLFLPIGKDYVWYNLGRIYGEIRLPKLLEGWWISPETPKPYYHDESVLPTPSFLLLRKFK